MEVYPTIGASMSLLKKIVNVLLHPFGTAWN